MRRLLERRGIDRVPRQHRHQAEDQRQLAVGGAAEIEPHGERVRAPRPWRPWNNTGGDWAGPGRAAASQENSTSSAVTGLPSEKRAAGVEAEGDIAARVVGLDAPGEQAIEREGLVIAARHQAFDHKTPDLLDGDAADDEGIEAVEGSKQAPDQPAALRRIGIGVGHVRETGRQGRFAVHRERVALGRRVHPAAAEQRLHPKRGRAHADTRRRIRPQAVTGGQRFDPDFCTR